MTRPEELYQQRLQRLHLSVDRLFFWLLLIQWAVAIVFALVVSPRAWAGLHTSIHAHVLIAVVLGGILNSLPLTLITIRPGTQLTRHVVAASQMLWSAIFIHLTGGRIETHFHIFGSLAFLAFYRDRTLLLTATALVALDHLVRGFLLPESVYGIANPEWWRFLEHAAWVAFEDVVLFFGCQRELGAMREVAGSEADLEAAKSAVEDQVVERTAQLQESMRRYRSLVENTNAVPLEYDLATKQLAYIAPQVGEMFQCSPETLKESGVQPFLLSDDRERFTAYLESLDPAEASPAHTMELRASRADGRLIHLSAIFSARVGNAPMQALMIDVSKQKQLELDLRQAQKLELVGRLASGVAHEINTPVQFVSDSVHFVRDAVTSYTTVIDKLRNIHRVVVSGGAADDLAAQAAEATDTLEASNLDYLMTKVPRALERSLDGIERISTIVRSMKEFAHPDSSEMTTVDLNRAVESTLTIARNEYKYVADVETHFADLPPICCFVGEINQAVLNIVVNAAHSIGDRIKGTDAKGRITIHTKHDGDDVVVSISDTGCGIPAGVREHIFEPFFTTKEVGRGTGQGLALSRSVVQDKHRGALTFETEVGKGSTFFIRLPVAGAKADAKAAPSTRAEAA